MLRSYVKTAIRNLLRQKGYSFINIAGLTLGLTGCLLIFQYVAFEYSFDAFNENASNLYRVILTEEQSGGESHTSALTGYAMGPAWGQEVPEIVQLTRLHPEYGSAIVSNPADPTKTFEEGRVENFAYRVDVGPAVFVAVGAVVLVIALLTVSYQSVKAPIADPVESLRYE